ncbi:hypothetical protein HON22_03420 [Candidatus Peregrinibacteria bacterium]|nr:hypothetical protein [Candidatus Peregrinibacteria bacterium]
MKTETQKTSAHEISELLDQSYVATCKEMGYSDEEINQKLKEHEERAEKEAIEALESMGIFPPDITEVQIDTSQSANQHVSNALKKPNNSHQDHQYNPNEHKKAS